MRNTFLVSLLLALLSAFSLPSLAAPGKAGGDMPPTIVSAEMAEGSVNLNSADAATLQSSLAGIGKAKAEAIVAYREANGAFASIDELLEVKGIGQALIERNREKLTVK
ncbi:helix-hairpin-helix domain-containing protein [Pseudomonas qingdaonensis]|uniref:ComEA family DNA-binding protein n=1 Tax=Pseudomonas qingdaonensis TaxID=2056231 RepID=UPI002E194636|nr:helix-hairpin-helix domain-containing protein [Pseudomonas qingdaonensis]